MPAIAKGQVHPDDLDMMARVETLARLVADQFGMRLDCVEHKRRPHPGGAYGLCYQNDFRISIVVRYREGKHWWSTRLSDAIIFTVVLHEVAHLGGLPDGRAHQALQRTMEAWVRANHPEYELPLSDFNVIADHCFQ